MNPCWQAFHEQARGRSPEVAIILGSGHSQLMERLTDAQVVAFADVPGLTPPTVAGHEGKLVQGNWAGKRVLLFAGRLHYYEGHPWEQVVQTVRLAHQLGAGVLLTTNSVGGIRADLEPGAILAVADHVECTRAGWWRHAGPARPRPYSSRLLSTLRRADGTLPSGLYAQVTGPCYETCAEVRALQFLGVDAVGMSTACEIQAGHALGLECAALSCVTNRAAGLSAGGLHHGEVLAIAAQQREKLAHLIDKFLAALD